jgi:superfamily II DNA or RNA helicase
LSATPERDYDDGFEAVLAPALGPIIYRYDLNAAMADGIIAPFELVNVAVSLSPSEQLQYNKLTRRIIRTAKKLGADSPIVEALLRRRARISALAAVRVPVAIRLLEQQRGVRALVFHEDIEQAERLLEHLKTRNHSATIYHSKIGPSVRRDNLRLFRRGVFDVLVCCRALDEGVNIPEVRTAIIASATASNRQRIQRLGRVLRPAPGKTHAVVYTLYATQAEERRLTREAKQLTSARSVKWQRTSY